MRFQSIPKYAALTHYNMRSMSIGDFPWFDTFAKLTFGDHQELRASCEYRLEELNEIRYLNSRTLHLYKGIYGIKLCKVTAKKESRKQFEERLLTELLKEIRVEPLSNILWYAAQYLRNASPIVMRTIDLKHADAFERYAKLMDKRIKEVR